MKQDIIDTNQIHLNNVIQNHTNTYHALFELLEGIYQDIVELDLETETVFVLRNCDNPEQVGNRVPFMHEADIFCERKIMAEDMNIAKKLLSLKELHKFYNSGEKNRSVELRVSTKDYVYEWVEISILALLDSQEKAKKILITVRNIDNQKLMKSIVDRFVYDSCDYFIYLDTKADSYVMFSGSNDGTPLPPTICDHYSTEIVKYAQDYVVPEDQKYTISQMNLEVVRKALDERGEHIFYCGVMDPIKGYTRKCLRYLYYDKENKKVLLIRTDVTGVYLLEKKKNDQLRQALKEARTDSLTGIYNRKAVETLIQEFISNCQCLSPAALFFIDIDNFKQINDCLGHSQGDDILCFLANKLKRITPTNSIVGRFGGDEFVVFCKNLDVGNNLKELATQICCSFDDLYDYRIKEFGVSCSVGISIFSRDATSYEELYEHADKALYISKNNNKKQFTIFNNKI